MNPAFEGAEFDHFKNQVRLHSLNNGEYATIRSLAGLNDYICATYKAEKR